MNKEQIQEQITTGKAALGVEFGSTRIKAVLVATDYSVIAVGSHNWENKLEGGVWTYSLEDVWTGLQSAYKNLTEVIDDEYGVKVTRLASFGIAAMMHGYLAFDKDNQLLVPFRTWRNAITGQAAAELTEMFDFNIPQRWSIAHLYQAILNQETHVKEINFFTTLAGYVHWRLTGEKVIGIGDASGMFPIDSNTNDYNQEMINQFSSLKTVQQYLWELRKILPTIKLAGEEAGKLTAAGAKLLDPSGTLQPDAIAAAPEGDAGTGMVSTNSVKQRTANVSAGTSAFAMVVLEKELSQVNENIDMVTTPDGSAVAMVHINNSTSEINSWARVFTEFAAAIGATVTGGEIFSALFNSVLKADPDAGGLLSYGYHSGENITGMAEGRPMFVRTPNAKFTLANLMRMHIYSAFGAMKIGLDVLAKEQVAMDSVIAQGGIFTTPVVAQKMLAGVMNTPVTLMKNAGEGGPWGMAVLSQFVTNHAANQTLADYLDNDVFKSQESTTIAPDPEDVAGFAKFMARYEAGLSVEQAAIDQMPVVEED
ncbi:xylulokinase [Weissella sagaensis]|uniref:xylulokinase n=1 Tax=Weissella sagaensis TaxID=2559928 RepID=UPI00214D111E|nr:FGGY-family carbohydrate kinase [Weissella sagaensis]